MRKQKNSKFIRLVALAINLQMIYSPMAYSDLGSIINSTAQITNTAANTLIQMNMQNSTVEQIQNQLGSYQAQELAPMLATVPAFASCKVFMGATNLPETTQRCEAENHDPNFMQYYGNLKTVANSNIETYQDFVVLGNANTSEGKRCLENVEALFIADLNQRVGEVRKLLKAEFIKQELVLEAQEKSFKKDFEALQLQNAELFGKPQDVFKDIDFDLTKNDETGENDLKCESIFGKTELKKLGDEGGYAGIKDAVDQLAYGNGGQAGQSAKSFQSKAANLDAEIIKLANDAYSRVQDLLDSSPERLTGNSSKDVIANALKSQNSLQKSPGFTNALNKSLSALEDKVANINSQVFSILGENNKNLQRHLHDPKIKTSSIADLYAKQTDTQCINHFVSQITDGGDISSFQQSLLTRPDNFNISSQMQEEMDNPTKSGLATSLLDNGKTLSERISGMSSKGLQDTKFRISRSITVEGMTFNPGEHALGDILQAANKYCTNSFHKSEGPNGEEAPSVIKSRIEKYHSELVSSFEQLGTNVKKEIRDELLECKQDTSTGKAPNSCSAKDIYNVQSAGFCARTAKTCAQNTTACANKAKTLYTNKRNTQVAKAREFNQKAELLRVEHTGKLLENEHVLEAIIGKRLDSLFPEQKYASIKELNAKNLKKMIPLPELQFITDGNQLDPTLKVHDTDAYFANSKANLMIIQENIESNLAAQIEAIKEKINFEKENIYKNATEQLKIWKEIDLACGARKTQFDREQVEMTNKLNEDNKTLNEAQNKAFNACVNVRAMKRCPTDGEFSKLTEALDDVVVAGAYSNASNALKELNSSCEDFNNDSGNYHDATNENIPPWRGAKNFCDKQSYHSDCDSFNALSTQKENYCQDNPNLSSLIDTKVDELCLVNGCKTEEEKRRAKSTALTKLKEEAVKKCEKLTTDVIAAEAKIQESFKSYSRGQYVSTFGQQKNISCGGTVAGDLGKSVTDGLNNLANTAAGAFSQPK